MARKLTPHYRYSGVYMIKCERNGKVYIGSSYDIEKRLAIHQTLLIRGDHPNIELQKDFNECGKMTTHVLYVEPTSKDLGNHAAARRRYAMEQKYIEEFNSIEYGYNRANVGKMYLGGPCRRVKTTEYIPEDDKKPQA